MEDRTGDSLLAKLIEEDHGLELRGRWGRSDTKSSLVYDAQRDLFFYNKEDIAGDAFTYLTQMRGWDFNTAKEYLKQNNFTATFVQEISNGQEQVIYPKLLEIWSENLEEGDKTYFYNRMLTDETIRRFKLGYFNQFYTIPIFMDGTLKQFQMRRDSPKLIKNYYQGVGPLLFHSEILQITDKIYFTEGLIGTILLSQMGIPACSMNIGVDGFQAKWTKYFVRQKEVILLGDNDEAGINGSLRTAKILGQHRCKIYTFNDFEGKGYAVDDFLIDGFGIEDLEERIRVFGKYAFEFEEKKVYTRRTK
jgi:DNA primase